MAELNESPATILPDPSPPAVLLPRPTWPTWVEILLCSGYPTQIVVGQALILAGLSPQLANGSLSPTFVFLLSRWTKRIVPALVFFSVWQLVFHWLDLYWNVMPSYQWQVAFHDGARIVAGPLTGNTAFHRVGFSPVDVTVWIGLVGVFLLGLGRNLKGNLIPTKDPTLPASLAHEVQ